MNEAQEHRLLETLSVIANHVEALDTALIGDSRRFHLTLLRLEDKLTLIADGVAPPVNEPSSDPPPVLRTAERIYQAIQDDITRMKAEVADLREQLENHLLSS